jgi:hypothetical protein
VMDVRADGELGAAAAELAGRVIMGTPLNDDSPDADSSPSIDHPAAD